MPNNHVFTGNIQVRVGDPLNGAKELVRSIQPLRVAKKFYVDVTSQRITGCGASMNDIMYVVSNRPPVRNGPNDSTYSLAQCPRGLIPIGGGWLENSTATIPGCPGQPYAAALASKPDQFNNGWTVLLLCHEYRAYATCQRANLARGP